MSTLLAGTESAFLRYLLPRAAASYLTITHILIPLYVRQACSYTHLSAYPFSPLRQQGGQLRQGVLRTYPCRRQFAAQLF